MRKCWAAHLEKGSNHRDWAQYEIVMYVSNRAKAIAAGLLVSGPGQAWISDVKFTVVPEAQLNTELLKDTGAPPF